MNRFCIDYRPSPKIHWMLSEVYKQGFVFDKSYTNYKLAIFLCPSVLFYCFTSGFKLYLVQVLYFEQLGYFIACPRFISPFIDYFRQCLNSVLAPILFEWSLLLLPVSISNMCFEFNSAVLWILRAHGSPLHFDLNIRVELRLCVG